MPAVLYSTIYVVCLLCASLLTNELVKCSNEKTENLSDSPLTVTLLKSNSDKVSLEWPSEIIATTLSYRTSNEDAEFVDVPTDSLENPNEVAVDSCHEYEFRLSTEQGNYFAKFDQKTRLREYKAEFQVEAQKSTAEGIVVKITFTKLPADMKPKFDLTAFSAASGAVPSVKVVGENTAEILIAGKNVDRIQKGEPVWFIVILKDVENSCGETFALGSAQHHHVLNVKCEQVEGLECKTEKKSVSAYCYLPRVVSVPLDKDKILVNWKFDQTDETFPKAPISEYAIRYGPVVNTDKVTFKQDIEATNIITIDPKLTHTVLEFPIDCTKDYKIQICAVFDQKPDRKSWHLLNSHNLSTSMACRWDDDYLPSIDWFLGNIMNLTRQNLGMQK